MTDETTIPTFHRTLPVFDSTDRKIIQRLLHYAVSDVKDFESVGDPADIVDVSSVPDLEDVAYDHPDRKVARDIYHQIREGDAIRLWIGPDLISPNAGTTPPELVISYDTHEIDGYAVVETFRWFFRSHEYAPAAGEEWSDVRAELDAYRDEIDRYRDGGDAPSLDVGFEYLY